MILGLLIIMVVCFFGYVKQVERGEWGEDEVEYDAYDEAT